MVAHHQDELLGIGELVCGHFLRKVYSASDGILHGDRISRISVDGHVVLHDDGGLCWLVGGSGCVDSLE